MRIPCSSRLSLLIHTPPSPPFLGHQAERTVITLNKYNIKEPPEMTGKIQNYVPFAE